MCYRPHKVSKCTVFLVETDETNGDLADLADFFVDFVDFGCIRLLGPTLGTKCDNV